MTRDSDYRCAVAGPMDKVPREGPYSGRQGTTMRIEMARGEYEGVQIVVEAADRELRGLRAEVSDLRAPEGTIPASCVTGAMCARWSAGTTPKGASAGGQTLCSSCPRWTCPKARCSRCG